MATALATVTGIASSASSVTLILDNQKRQALSIYNASTQILYLNCTNTAANSSGNYMCQIAPNSYFELPICAQGVFTGKLTGIWASANGYAQICEYSMR